MNMNVLEVKNVSFSYDGSRQILKGIDIDLREGELVSILGASGGGKTTLFHIIAGIYAPDEGRVLLKGEDITGRSGRISYMLQKDLLMDYRTIEDNVALPLVLRGVSRRKAREQAAPYFERFGLEGTQKKYPKQLSGGMRQRAALLRTYMFSGEAALLDEPFSALDALTKSSMHSWYLNVMEEIQLPTLFITHDIDEAILLSDRIFLLGGSPGRIRDEIVIEQPKPRTEDFLLTDRFIEYKRAISARLKEFGAAGTSGPNGSGQCADTYQ